MIIKCFSLKIKIQHLFFTQFSNDDTVNRWNWHEKVNRDAERLEQEEHDLDNRKEKRQTRTKPWMEPTPPLNQRDPEEKIGLLPRFISPSESAMFFPLEHPFVKRRIIVVFAT